MQATKQTKLLDALKDILLAHPLLVDRGELVKSKIRELAHNLDPALLRLLLKNNDSRQFFFRQIDDITVFDKVGFIRFINNKQFLADSYTEFSNKIGLVSNGYDHYISENKAVVLAFPYKDCVLEGGQTRDDAKRQEVFWNETLAPDQIDQLLKPKVLTNWQYYNTEGVAEPSPPQSPEVGKTGGEAEAKIWQLTTPNPTPPEKRLFDVAGGGVPTLSEDTNLVLKGNNLLCLHSIMPVYRNKVKLIYIDPPYNNGVQTFGYNDAFNHSTWLVFMKSRLRAAKELLANDGAIFINLDDKEVHYCKVLADEIFGRDNFVANIIWQKKNVVQNDARFFNNNHDHIIVYAKNKNNWNLNLLQRTDEMNDRYENPDNDPRGVWTSVALQAKSGSTANLYEITFPNGVMWRPVEGTFPRLNRESMLKAYDEGRLWFGKNGKNVPRLKKYLNEVQQGLVPNSIFTIEDGGSTQSAKEELKALFSNNEFATPKPERLIKRIIEIATDKNDLVLDFFAGSGTTAAVALKMGRRFITCEQMDYVETITKARLQKVINGEQGGISKSVGWQGGGSFLYAELLQYNGVYLAQIDTADSKATLQTVWEAMQQNAFLSYRITPTMINKAAEDWNALTLDEQKQLLRLTLDKNLLYVPHSEIEDADYAISDIDKKMNAAFYSKK